VRMAELKFAAVRWLRAAFMQPVAHTTSRDFLAVSTGSLGLLRK